MTVHILKFNGNEATVSVAPSVATLNEGATRADIASKIRQTGNSYYLLKEDVVLSERKPCISMQAQAMDLASSIPDSESVLLVPFDDRVYMARLVNSAAGAVVTEESLLSLNDLQELYNSSMLSLNNEKVYYVAGGRLSKDVKMLGIADLLRDRKSGQNAVVHVTLSGPGRLYALKKKDSLDRRIIAMAAIFLGVVAFTIYLNYDTEEEVAEEVKIEYTAPEVGVQLVAFAKAIDDGEALIMHNLIRITGDANQISYQGAYFGGETDYRRLKELAVVLGGRLDVLGNVWRIYGVPLNAEPQDKVELQDVKDSIDALIKIEAKLGHELAIGTARQLARFTERTDSFVMDRQGLSSADIEILGNELDDKQVLGRMIRTEIGRTDSGLWRTAKIEFSIRGN